MRCKWLIAMGLLLSLGVGTNPAIAADTETNQVEHVVREYVEGWKAGDVARLQEVLAPDGHIVWVSDEEGEQQLSSVTFSETLENRRPRDIYELTAIHSVDVVDGQLAVVKLEIERKGGSYIDYLTLQKINENWFIVNKVFVVR